MATAVAAMVAKARRDIVSHFMSQNAVSAKDAVSYEPGRRIERRQFEQLKNAAVLEEVAGDKYWLNVPVYDQWKRKIRTRMAVMVGAGVAAAAIAALFAG